MKVLLVTATHFEIEGILMALPEIAEVNPKLEIDFLVTCPGIFHTAFELGSYLVNHKFDLIINLGIAGSFKKDLAPGDVVVVNRDYFADFGAEDGPAFLNAFELGLVNRDQKPFNKGWLTNEPGPELPVAGIIRQCKGITVNTAHGSTSSVKKVVERLNPEVETMEGAAFMYICLSKKIPCIQIRAISNRVERRNRNAWNVPLAIGNLNDYVIGILKHI